MELRLDLWPPLPRLGHVDLTLTLTLTLTLALTVALTVALALALALNLALAWLRSSSQSCWHSREGKSPGRYCGESG